MCHITNFLSTKVTTLMEDTQCLPCHSSHTLQRNYSKWQPEPGTHARTDRQATRMGGQTNSMHQATLASGPVPGQVERFSKAHDSWELMINVHAKDLVKEFYKKYPKAIQHITTQPTLIIRATTMSAPTANTPLPLTERIDSTHCH